MMISWYLKVDLEQTQRLVEREEGLSLAHKFNCSFYETSAAHRCHQPILSHIKADHFYFYSGGTWTTCSTLSSGRSESATRRASSKRTRRRVGKKSGTIFSKRSSEEGGRFEKVHFCYFQDFHIYSDQSFASFKCLKIIQISCLEALPNQESKIIYLNSAAATKTMKLSELQKHGVCFDHPRHSQTYFWLISRFKTVLWEFVTVLNMQCFIHVLISLSKVLQRQTLLYLLDVTNIIDITSQAHFLIYHRKHTLTWEKWKIHDESYNLTF